MYWVWYHRALRTMTRQAETLVRSSLMSLHVAAPFRLLSLIWANPSHIRDLCYSLSLRQPATRAALGPGLWNWIQTDSGAFNSFLPARGPKSENGKRWVPCRLLGELSRPLCCGALLGSPDWFPMGSYDAASLGSCSCWLQAVELWHTMRLLLFSVPAWSVLVFRMFYWIIFLCVEVIWHPTSGSMSNDPYVEG